MQSPFKKLNAPRLIMCRMHSRACVLQSLLFLAFAALPSLGQESRALFVPIKFPALAVAATNEISPGPTQQLFEGVPFLIGQHISLMGLEAARHGILHPKQVLNIPVGAMIDRFYLLHTVVGPDKEGRPLANVVLRYINGASYSFRLAYGIHARNGQITSQMPDLP